MFRSPAPMHLVWSLTNVCNLRCAHCYAASRNRDPGELTFDEARAALDSFVEAGVFDIAFSGGEVLIRSDTISLIRMASEAGITCGLGSNGWLITPRRARELKQVGLARIQISLDGMIEEHDRLRGRHGVFDRALRAISYCQEAGLQVNVCFTVTSWNYHQLWDMATLCAALGVDTLNVSQFVPTGRGGSELDLDPQTWRIVYEQWHQIRTEMVGRLKLTSHLSQICLVDEEIAAQPGFRGCQAGHDQAAISPRGEVYPCILLPIPVGNVREQSLAEIWRGSPILERLRDRLSFSGPCGGCLHIEKCGGCRAVAFALHGDAFSSDPRCWHPRHQQELVPFVPGVIGA